jgi:eukaryotic-like serine/threonine-protein kinase
MSLGRFLISKVFFKNLLIAAIITIVIVLIAWQGLAIFTRHGKHMAVPDYSGLTLADIENYRIGREFNFILLDSVYDNSLAPGSVVMQDPPANSRVKKERKIYLTTVAFLPEQVRMPDLVDLTFRQAMSSLETHGLKVGKLEYVPDIAKNAVLQQLHQGEVIETGTFIVKGSFIDLILGQGLGTERIPVPFLLGLSMPEAHRIILENSLNIGANIFETETEDPADTTARIYRQNPVWRENAFLRMGQPVDLWYRSNLEFNFDSLLQPFRPDTLNYYDSIYLDTTF